MTLQASPRLTEVHDLALLDLDGVVYRGPEAIPHAATSLAAARDAGMAIAFITNNASREPGTVADHLVELGISAEAGEVLTAAQAAAVLLAQEVPAGSRVLVVGGDGLLTAVREAGFTVVTSADDEPVAVVQGFAPQVSWRELAEAAYAVQRGATHIASNLDLTLPNERGFAPGNGSLVGAVVNATGVTPLSAGKPEPAMYLLAVDRVGARRPLVVGDRLDTDLRGARAADYPGLHVLTGVSDARDVVLAAAPERPTYLGLDLRALLEEHPAPEPGPDGWWTCRGRAATVQDGELRLDGGEVDLDLVRAACGAAWSAADAGQPLRPEAVPALDPAAGAVHGP